MDPSLAPQAQQQPLSNKHTNTPVLIFCCLLSGLLCAIGGYQLGVINGALQVRPLPPQTAQQPLPSTAPRLSPSDTPTKYTLTYSIPAGWHTILWHPTPTSTSSAIVSPDYTGFNNPSYDDPDPQTGIAIFIWRMPKPAYSLQQLRSQTEMSEDGMQKIASTTIAGLPAYHATFISTDSQRILDTYHILKDTDHWVVSFNFQGNSLTEVTQEENRYSSALTAFLNSILFQEYFNRIQVQS